MRQQVILTLTTVLGTELGEPLGIRALFDPWSAESAQPTSEIDLGVRISIRTGAIVDRQRGILFHPLRVMRGRQRYFTDGNAKVTTPASNVFLP
jgi:hypothetical protein